MRLMEAQASFQWSTLSFIAKVYKTIVIHSLFSLKKNFFVGKLSTFILSSHLSISNPLCSILFIKNFSNFSFTEVGFYAKCQWHRRSCSECLRMFATEIQAGKTRHNGWPCRDITRRPPARPHWTANINTQQLSKWPQTAGKAALVRSSRQLVVGTEND